LVTDRLRQIYRGAVIRCPFSLSGPVKAWMKIRNYLKGNTTLLEVRLEWASHLDQCRAGQDPYGDRRDFQKACQREKYNAHAESSG
jgi:hypothetical protein